MKKITDFMINKRHIILSIFIALTIISGFLATKVEINTDLTVYLPEDSQTRIGTEIMKKEFKDSDSPGSLNLMFKNITEKEKTEILENLSNIKGVSKIDYDNTENYNKKDYTLYVVNTEEKSNSKISKNIYEKILEDYEDYEIYTSGSIKASNTEILPTWIMVTSIVCAMIILIIMCDSYLEPFLFLISILIAVILNAGTNIIFKSVSEVTNSISAILVMALSMDYSIMLINRFRSERENEKNDIKAMQNALYHSFQSITSSSLTTIVGLITLVFMSFTIGKDLGLVLAKGVFLSLISIFLCLPTLILTFDKWITKTQKKTINPKLTKLGNISYKLKMPITFLFIIIFIGSTLLKGNLKILYTSPESNKIGEIFGNNNQIALIYKNDFEENISEYLKALENKNKVTSVLGYGNTLNEKLEYNNLNSKLSTLGANIKVEDYFLKILYYHYFNKEENNTVTLNEFYNFIINENSSLISEEEKQELTKLKYFINHYEINKDRNTKELANILNMNEENINDILVYYNAKNNNLELTLNEFIKFIINDILPNPKYSSLFDEATLNKIKIIETYIDKEYIMTEFSSNTISDILNVSKNNIDLIILSKYSKTDNGSKLTLNEFTNEIINLKNNTNFLDNINIELIELLNTFTEKTNITAPLDKQTIKNFFEPNLVDLVYIANNLLDTDTISLEYFIKSVIKINEANNILNEDELKNFILIEKVINDTLTDPLISYTSTELSEFLNLDIELLNSLYALIDFTSNNIDNWTISISETINIIIENEKIVNSLDEETLNNIVTLHTIINLTLNETKLTSENISEILKVEKNNIELLYGLYVTTYINKEISLNKIINFLLTDIVNNENTNTINETNKNNLLSIKKIIDDSLSMKKYTKENMYRTLSTLTDKINQNEIDLMYMYYGSVNNYDINWKITIEELIYYLNDEIIIDERFNNFIEENIKNDIIKAKEQIIKTKSLLVGKNHSRIIINTKLEFESDETYKFIENISDEIKNKNIEEFYIIGDSSMAYEMNKTFTDEFNFISILTMIFLMIVVAISFKSLIIPIILVLLIQSAVYLTMGILSITVGTVYFIALLVVQSILMGATIDYAIVYTSYYLEYRQNKNVKDSILSSYSSSIHTILTSSSILIIVTFILGIFAKDITSKICITISEGTLCSTLLILLILPGTLALFDKIIVKNKTK